MIKMSYTSTLIPWVHYSALHGFAAVTVPSCVKYRLSDFSIRHTHTNHVHYVLCYSSKLLDWSVTITKVHPDLTICHSILKLDFLRHRNKRNPLRHQPMSLHMWVLKNIYCIRIICIDDISQIYSYGAQLLSFGFE